jgi:hypothetical protein
MEGSELTGDHTLVESAVAGPEHCSAIGAELRGQAEARGHDVPGVHRAQTADDDPRFVSVGIERAQILTDSAGMVETETGIDRQPVPDRQSVACERANRHELTAGIGGISRRGLRWLSIVVGVPSAGRNDLKCVVLAPIELRAGLPLVIRMPQCGPKVGECYVRGRANLSSLAHLLRGTARDSRH